MKSVHKPRILISWFLLLTCCCFVGSLFAANAKDKRAYNNSNSKYFNIGIKEVLSGDIIRLDNDKLLRLIGIDTPEVMEGNRLQFDSKVSKIPEEVLRVMGNEAKCFIEKLIDGKRVRVEFDKKGKDNYGDLLGYVFILPEKSKGREIFLNAEVIKNGYTYKINTSPNSRYMSLFEKLHGYAEKAQTSQLWQQWRR